MGAQSPAPCCKERCGEAQAIGPERQSKEEHVRQLDGRLPVASSSVSWVMDARVSISLDTDNGSLPPLHRRSARIEIGPDGAGEHIRTRGYGAAERTRETFQLAPEALAAVRGPSPTRRLRHAVAGGRDTHGRWWRTNRPAYARRRDDPDPAPARPRPARAPRCDRGADPRRGTQIAHSHPPDACVPSSWRKGLPSRSWNVGLLPLG